MIAAKGEQIILPTPRSNLITMFGVGIFCLIIGLVTPFLAGGQLVAFGMVFFFIIGGVYFLYLSWKTLHAPALIIDEGGIRSLRPLMHVEIKWEEIDFIYIYRDVFSVDLSPSGLVSYFDRQGKRPPRGLDITESQMALSIKGINLPIPVEQLLDQIRERFSSQLERYHIELENLDNQDNNEVIGEEGIVNVVKHRHLYGICGILLVIAGFMIAYNLGNTGFRASYPLIFVGLEITTYIILVIGGVIIFFYIQYLINRAKRSK